MLALTGTARRWEPKRLRLRLFSIARRLARGGRRLRLRLAGRWPWAGEVTAAVTRLQALPSGLPSRNHSSDRKGAAPGRVEPRPLTRRNSRAARHDLYPEITTSRTVQTSTSGTRKIEVRLIVFI